jgi:DNA-binding MarR family transcriptional regulator
VAGVTTEGTPFHIPALIKRAQLAAKAAVDEALRPLGLSGAQYGVLRLLGETPDLSGAELARQLSVTAQSMNELLAVLVAHGYIDRKPHPTNKRIVRLRPTAAGRRASAKAATIVERVIDQMLSGLTSDERRRLASYLERCIGALETPVAHQLPA